MQPPMANTPNGGLDLPFSTGAETQMAGRTCGGGLRRKE